jgi:hypothetical protein
LEGDELQFGKDEPKMNELQLRTKRLKFEEDGLFEEEEARILRGLRVFYGNLNESIISNGKE